MPQASEKLTKQWDGPSDRKALQHLFDRGFILTRGWEWVPPAGYTVGEDDLSAIQFMMEEWDYGYLVEVQGL